VEKLMLLQKRQRGKSWSAGDGAKGEDEVMGDDIIDGASDELPLVPKRKGSLEEGGATSRVGALAAPTMSEHIGIDDAGQSKPIRRPSLTTPTR
jgi:hypothetical protein